MKYRKSLLVKRSLLVLWTFFFSYLAGATTISVTSTDDSGAGTLRSAVVLAANGDTIVFDAATNGTPIALASQITIDKDIYLFGNDSTNTILSGNSVTRILEVEGVVHIEGIRFQESFTTQAGGAIFVDAQAELTVNACHFEDNEASSGGAINNFFTGESNIMNCAFYGNKSLGNQSFTGGAISAVFGTLNEDIRIENCIFKNNSSTHATGEVRGGAIYLLGTKTTISNCEFEGNSLIGATSSNRRGGAIFATGASIYPGDLTVINSTFRNHNYGSVGSGPNEGGGVAVVGRGNMMASLQQCTFENNHITSVSGPCLGGGLYADVDSLLVEACYFNNNSVTVTAGTGIAYGGALHPTEGRSYITHSTFTNNVANSDAGGSGGGAMRSTSGVDYLLFENNTVYNNSASTTSGPITSGGGLFIIATDSLRVVNNTIVGNALSGATGTNRGGGLSFFPSNATRFFYNNIIYNNTGSTDFMDVQWDGVLGTHFVSNNLVGDGIDYASWTYNTDPGLDAAGAQNNGGPVPTIALVNPLSDAVNNANSAQAPELDQRFASRNGNPDLGAYELGGCFVSFSTSSISACISYTSPSGNFVWTTSGTYLDTIPNAAGCDSILTVNLTILSPTANTITEDVCDSYTTPSGNQTFFTSGVYMDTIMNAVGCDSVLTINLTVRNSTSAGFTITTCDSFTIPSGITYTSSGIYRDTIPNAAGCDSVITFNAIILNSTTASINPVACNSYTVPSGDETYTTSGTYMDTLMNAVGCDSILTINLTINNATTGAETVTSCDSYTSPSGNHTFTTSGVYLDTLTNAVGCDSVITINLTINNSSASSATLTVCDSYLSPAGNTYSVSGTYLDTLTNAVGCDSVIATDLTVLNSTSETIMVTACDSYTVPTGVETYTVSGTYLDTLMNAVGCDSILTINLTINNSSTGSETVTSCDSYTSPSGNHTFTTSGVYLDTLSNAVGCDSVITINLTINNSSASSATLTVCDAYLSPAGNTYSVSGTYLDTLTNGVGCDSVITTDLTVLNSTSETITVTACSSYTVPSGDETYTASALVMDTIPNAAGCDSIITIDLTILEVSFATINETTCNSYTVPSGDETYTSSGIYNDTLLNAAGCDSVLTINLTILNATASTQDVAACYSFTSPSGTVWDTSGVYMDTIMNAVGCDSVITFNVSINSTSAMLTEVVCDSYLSPSGMLLTTTGIYQDTIPNAAGCDSVITLDLTVNSLDVNVTTVSGNTLSADETAASYQWIDCTNGNSPIAGETNQVFVATANGSYAVILDNGTCVDTSACVTLTTVGINEFETSTLVGYPNPTRNRMTIETPQSEGELMIFSSDGKLVKALHVTAPTMVLDLVNVENGVYLLTYISKNQKTNMRVVVQH